MNDHYRNLERMYLNAPVQKIYTGIEIKIEAGKSFITLPVMEKFFHAEGSLHGSVYFRLLDDAAYFSVSSMFTDEFLLTSSFHIDLLRPVNEGKLKAEGYIINQGRKLFLAGARLFNDKGKLIATGKGTFMKSGIPLNMVPNYENNK